MDLELTKLYNTLMLIETKGESTITMADCLRFTKQLIAQAKADREAQVKAESTVENSAPIVE